MSYVNKSLLDKESILIKANMSNWIYFNEFLYLGLIGGYFAYGHYVVMLNYMDNLLFLSPLLFLWLLTFLKEIIRDKSTELGLTNKRLIGKKGFIRIKTLDTPLENIDNVQIHFSFWGRIFRYGTLIIESKSEAYTYKAISKPLKLKQEISRMIVKP